MANDMLRLLMPAQWLSAQGIGLGLVVAFALAWTWFIIVQPRFFSQYRNLPGPPHTSSLRGNLPESLSFLSIAVLSFATDLCALVFEAGPGVIHKRYLQEYGPFVRYSAFFGKDRLVFTDNKALTHMLLTKSYTYAHPVATREQISKILGKGLLFADGDDHKRQRRIMVPAFGPAHVNALLPIFAEKGRILRERWLELIEKENQSSSEKDAGKRSSIIDVSKWFSRATLDIIGSAGFNYEFASLSGEVTGLAKSFDEMLSVPFSAGIFRQLLFVLVMIFPPLGNLPTERARKMKASKQQMQAESRKILDDAKQRMGDEADAKSSSKSKDLISLLLKANSAETAGKGMTSAEIMGQMTTFLLAGHETTATSLSWTILTLAQNKSIQTKLREEAIQAMNRARSEGREELTSSELDGLPYLDAVTSESLRLNPPVASTIRECFEDDVLPLAHPITLKNGQVVDHVPVSKGTTIFVPILPFNTAKEIWGPDADVFNPERWIQGLPEETMERTKGGFTAFARMLTFAGGPRSCIGYRFSVLELKAILFDIIQYFDFEPRDSTTEIIGKSSLVTKPFIKDRIKEGSQLPIKVTAIPSSD